MLVIPFVPPICEQMLMGGGGGKSLFNRYLAGGRLCEGRTQAATLSKETTTSRRRAVNAGAFPFLSDIPQNRQSSVSAKGGAFLSVSTVPKNMQMSFRGKNTACLFPGYLIRMIRMLESLNFNCSDSYNQ
jgi:hypothetical protein